MRIHHQVTLITQFLYKDDIHLKLQVASPPPFPTPICRCGHTFWYDLVSAGVLNFISGKTKGSSKLYVWGPNEHYFLSFSYIFLCTPEVIKGPNCTGWRAGFGPRVTYLEPLCQSKFTWVAYQVLFWFPGNKFLDLPASSRNFVAQIHQNHIVTVIRAQLFFAWQ